MTERTVVDVKCDVLRAGTLAGPIQWVRGDYSKVFSDGTNEPATFDEYVAFMGFPPMKNIEIVEQQESDDQASTLSARV